MMVKIIRWFYGSSEAQRNDPIVNRLIRPEQLLIVVAINHSQICFFEYGQIGRIKEKPYGEFRDKQSDQEDKK